MSQFFFLSQQDSESEYLVTEAIERAMKDRTVLVIAHRLSTVKNADQVLVMKAGEIVETGLISSSSILSSFFFLVFSSFFFLSSFSFLL